MAEFGIIAPQGIQRVPEWQRSRTTTGIPQMARETLATIVVQIENLTTSIRHMEKRIVAWCDRHRLPERRMSKINAERGPPEVSFREA
jgi:transposase